MAGVKQGVAKPRGGLIDRRLIGAINARRQANNTRTCWKEAIRRRRPQVSCPAPAALPFDALLPCQLTSTLQLVPAPPAPTLRRPNPLRSGGCACRQPPRHPAGGGRLATMDEEPPFNLALNTYRGPANIPHAPAEIFGAFFLATNVSGEGGGAVHPRRQAAGSKPLQLAPQRTRCDYTCRPWPPIAPRRRSCSPTCSPAACLAASCACGSGSE